MAIMSLATFKSKTHKYFSIRNGAIALIDTKLAAYHNGPNGARLIELRDAVNAFKDEKDAKFAGKNGDYTDSKREAKGGVTLLGQQVAAELAAPIAPVGQGMGAGIAQQARLQALARQQRAEADFVDINVPVTQQLDYRDGTGLHNFGWTVQLRLTERPTELAVTVTVKPTSNMVIVGDYKNRWKVQIQQSWNGAQLRVPGVGPMGQARTLPIVFDLDWKPAGYAGPAYEVDVHQPPPQPATEPYAKQGGSWVKQDAQPVVGTNVGTPHMGQWGADDAVAVVHEFGHMIGCPDEYYTKTFNNLAIAADIYDQVPFTTDSIMNNTGRDGRIFSRHYHLIRRQYEIWKNLAADSTTIIRT